MTYDRIDLTSGGFEPRPVLDDISVVIPTLGRPVLETCLGWIARGDAWPGRLIVVDQGLNPEVDRWLKSLDANGLRTEYIASRQRGRASGVNRGLERVTTRFVSVTDDDCFVDSDWLVSMHARLCEDPMSIVSGRVKPLGDENNVAVVTSLAARTYRKPRLTFDLMSGGNMGTSMDVIRRVGLYDEDPRLQMAEDCEWSYRALRASVPIRYTPDVSLRHYGWRDSGERIEQYRAYAKSHGGFYGKYIRRGDLFIALRASLHLLRCLKRWVTGTLMGSRENALRGKAYFLNLLPGIRNGMRRSDSERREA